MEVIVLVLVGGQKQHMNSEHTLSLVKKGVENASLPLVVSMQ